MFSVELLRNWDGAWRSPVAHLLWEQGVPGSNPGAPIHLGFGLCLTKEKSWKLEQLTHAVKVLDL